MSQEKLDRINKELDNAYAALDKFGSGGSRGNLIKADIRRLEAEKASLPPELLQKEKMDRLTSRFIQAVKAQRKFPDIVINQQDVEKYTEELQNEGMSNDAINQLIKTAEVEIADILEANAGKQQEQQSEKLTLALNRLTAAVKSYIETIAFKAELDPSVTVPADMIALIAEWKANETMETIVFGSTENTIMRAIQELEEYGISQDDIDQAIRSGST